MSQEFHQFIGGGSALLSFVGFALLAIGAWRLYLLTMQRTLVVSVVAIALQLLNASFWHIAIPLSRHLEVLNDFVDQLYRNPYFFEIISYVHIALNAAVYLPLAYYFFIQRSRKILASSPDSPESPSS